MATELLWDDVLLRLAFAGVLGALVGAERERHGHPAGFRTLTVLAIGAASVMILSIRVGTAFWGDPGRIAAQAVSGMGFLGAGAILRMGLTVHGLTTAATLWAVAAVGLVSGAGYLLDAAMASGLILATLTILSPLERRFLRAGNIAYVQVVALRRPSLMADVEERLGAAGQKIERMGFNEVSTDEVCVELRLRKTSAAARTSVRAVLLDIDGVKEVAFEDDEG